MTPETSTTNQAAPLAHLPRGPERFAALLDRELEGTAARRAKLLSTVLSECGYRRRSVLRLQSIQDALEARGIYSRPRLTEPQVRSHERLEFSRMAYSSVEPDLIFPDERALEDFVLRNYKQIPELSMLKSPKQQRHLPSGRQYDLMFRECRSNDVVILEFKAGDGGMGVVSQLFLYLKELLPIAQAERCGVRGIIISGEPNAHLEDQVRLLSEGTGIRVDWYCYVSSLKLVSLVPTTAQGPAEIAGSATDAGQGEFPSAPPLLAAAGAEQS